MTETREVYDAGSQAPETFTLELSRLELIAINRSLSDRLHELRSTFPDGFTGDTQISFDITVNLLRRVDKMLGII